MMVSCAGSLVEIIHLRLARVSTDHLSGDLLLRISLEIFFVQGQQGVRRHSLHKSKKNVTWQSFE